MRNQSYAVSTILLVWALTLQPTMSSGSIFVSLPLTTDKQVALGTSDQKPVETSQAGSSPSAGKAEAASTTAQNSPAAIFLRQFHTPAAPAVEPTRRAKLNW
jgi:hypothetical protein